MRSLHLRDPHSLQQKGPGAQGTNTRPSTKTGALRARAQLLVGGTLHRGYGKSIRKVQAPLNPVRSRVSQVGTMGNATSGMIINQTMNQGVKLDVPAAVFKKFQEMTKADLCFRLVAIRARVVDDQGGEAFRVRGDLGKTG